MTKAIIVEAKEWFDKHNGNSYCAVRITVDDKTYTLPFQYGYGSYYEQIAGEFLAKEGVLPKPHCLYSQCKELGIVYLSTKHEKCLKRDVIAWGE